MNYTEVIDRTKRYINEHRPQIRTDKLNYGKLAAISLLILMALVPIVASTSLTIVDAECSVALAQYAPALLV